MRITSEEHQAISDIIRQADTEAMIYLFGSRADDSAKGGDIDLLVLSSKITLMDKLDILAQLHQRIGVRKIDLVVFPDTARPFPKMVIETGVRL